MARVIRAAQADLDLETILDYLDQHSPRTAGRLAATIDQKCLMYAQFPEMGRRREELAPDLHSFTVEGYILFYRPIDDGIEVIRVIHGRPDLTSLFD